MIEIWQGKTDLHIPGLLLMALFLLFANTSEARAECASPVGNAGTIFYNTDNSILQYCDGTDWQGYGAVEAGGTGPTNGLMGHWKLDETSGTFADSSGNGNDGTANGTVDYAQTGTIDDAAGFDGGTEYINVPYDSSLTPTDDMTIVFWVRTDEDWDSIGGQIWRLMDMHSGGSDQNPGWYLIVNGWLGGNVYLYAGDGSGSASWGSSFSNWDTATWYHIAVVYEQNGATPSVTYYRNGAFSNTVTGAAITPDWGTDALRIGGGYYNDRLDGLMDDVRYYNRALNATEVQQLYNLGGSGGPCANPAATEGTLFYNEGSGVPQYCGGGTWIALAEPEDGPTGCSNIGDLCSDGSIFAGDTNLYVTDANQSNSTQWKATTGNDDINPDSTSDGAANHANITVVMSTLPAMDLCETLDRHGHQDWYLPAQDELAVLYTNRVAINANSTESFAPNHYWTSSENNANDAWRQSFNTGAQNSNSKVNGSTYVRCVRRETGAHCTSPAATEGTIFYNADESIHQVCSGGVWKAFELTRP